MLAYIPAPWILWERVNTQHLRLRLPEGARVIQPEITKSLRWKISGSAVKKEMQRQGAVEGKRARRFFWGETGGEK